ncbi:MAG: hypothetical protein ACTSP9_07250 [Promethearchaeota archaeon]
MPDYIINDKWIMDRISSQSSSFSNWMSGLFDMVENVIDGIDTSVMGLSDLKNFEDDIALAKTDLAKTKKEMDALDLGSFGGKTAKWATKLTTKWVTKQMQKSLHDSEEIGVDLDFDLDFITGKKRTLSSALFDVSKERGIDNEGLLYLIKSLPDLEAFLYSTSVQKYYRDHTEHALRVAVLGDFLLEQDTGQGKMSGIISELLEIDKKQLKEKVWWITSLLHDIGYPLGKMSTAVNFSLLNQLLKCYPSLDLEFIPFEITLSWKADQEGYLKIIEEGLSKEAKALIRKGSGILDPALKSQSPNTYLHQKSGHPEYKFTPTFDLDHGVISALSLLKGLGTPEEISTNDDYEGYIIAAKSMALHNFKDKLSDHNFDTQPLTFFLILIDELQEWGRPIPVQVRDTYFTTELEKVSLLDEISLHLDEFSWSMQFKNEQAKKLMNFDFQLFSREKEKSFGRLDRGSKFTKTLIDLQNIKPPKEKKETEQILAEVKIEI